MSLAPSREHPDDAARPDTGAATPAAVRQYLSFRLDNHIYALPLAQVAEITPYRELKRIPHMPASVAGLLDHRNQVVPVIDLRHRMGLPAQDPSLAENIVVLGLGGSSLVGVLVDAVESVVTTTPEQLVPASSLLAGPEGAWVPAFIVQGERIIALLDSGFIVALHGARAAAVLTVIHDQERTLDKGLQDLIALAPPRSTQGESGKIIPQIQEAVTHTEEEVGKVIERVEGMLASTDLGFQALARLKQEAALGRLKGEEGTLAQLDKLATDLQERIFDVLQRLQFQDIARQKLERVLKHIQGLQMVVGTRLRDPGRR